MIFKCFSYSQQLEDGIPIYMYSFSSFIVKRVDIIRVVATTDHPWQHHISPETGLINADLLDRSIHLCCDCISVGLEVGK